MGDLVGEWKYLAVFRISQKPLFYSAYHLYKRAEHPDYKGIRTPHQGMGHFLQKICRKL